ncbi:MAG: hypothetical protein IT367_18420 [Candidatus Hydrogenedentes bacterium]|nr:hypothetical protein [Candidatus Hydrogenedentota bacterium]
MCLWAIAVLLFAYLLIEALPGVGGHPKLADEVVDLKAISAALHAYYVDYGTYPPGYGFSLSKASASEFCRTSYTEYIGIDGAVDLYDSKSNGYDTDFDSVLSRLEYLPDLDSKSNQAMPKSALYAGGRSSQESSVQRPYIYIPFNKEQLRRITEQILAASDTDLREDLILGQSWTREIICGDSQAPFQPPPVYDEFVLMAVGRFGNSGGILVPLNGDDAWLKETGIDVRYAYNLLALRAAYLATRDLNRNDKLDFHYLARVHDNESSVYPLLPDGKTTEGPFIMESR